MSFKNILLVIATRGQKSIMFKFMAQININLVNFILFLMSCLSEKPITASKIRRTKVMKGCLVIDSGFLL